MGKGETSHNNIPHHLHHTAVSLLVDSSYHRHSEKHTMHPYRTAPLPMCGEGISWWDTWELAGIKDGIKSQSLIPCFSLHPLTVWDSHPPVEWLRSDESYTKSKKIPCPATHMLGILSETIPLVGTEQNSEEGVHGWQIWQDAWFLGSRIKLITSQLCN